MSQMLFGAVGGELFEGLANALGAVGIDLSADEARQLDTLGVGRGPADVRVLSGRIDSSRSRSATATSTFWA